MEVTILGKFLLSVLLAIILCCIIALLYPRSNDSKVGLGCLLTVPVALVVFFALDLIVIPKVIVISGENSSLTHDRKSMISHIKSPDGKSTYLSLCKKYLANFSNDTLVLYPEYCGPESKANSIKIEQPIEIPPDSVIEIKREPDCYFEPCQSQTESRSNDVEARWVLETAESIRERNNLMREFMLKAAP